MLEHYRTELLTVKFALLLINPAAVVCFKEFLCYE